MSHEIGKKSKKTNKEMQKQDSPQIIKDKDMKKHSSKGVINPEEH